MSRLLLNGLAIVSVAFALAVASLLVIAFVVDLARVAAP
jgi:hypothetical protein